MDVEKVCSKFLALCHEAESTTHGISLTLATFTDECMQRTKENQTSSRRLQTENCILKSDIAQEERWMHRIALDVLTSEEVYIMSCVTCLWHLSENSNNCLHLARDMPCMKAILDILVSETKYSIVEGCLGIFTNIMRGNESSEVFLKETEIIVTILEFLKKLISRTVDHFTKRLELCYIFIYNLSLSDTGANLLLSNWFTDILIESAEKHRENENLADIIITTINEIFDEQHSDRFQFLSYTSLRRLSQILESQSPTFDRVQLLTKLRTLNFGR